MSLRTRYGVALAAVLLLLLGVLLALGGQRVLAATNSVEFCTSCHEMRANNWEEWRKTVHASNRSGVVAGCADCHVPHDFPDVVWRKLGAARDVWSHLTGAIDTPEKFEAHRLEMATRVWQRMKATDSRECRGCHRVEAMSREAQGRTAQKQHQRIGQDGRTCIDCHYGIAHHEPPGGLQPADVVGEPSPG